MRRFFYILGLLLLITACANTPSGNKTDVAENTTQAESTPETASSPTPTPNNDVRARHIIKNPCKYGDAIVGGPAVTPENSNESNPSNDEEHLSWEHITVTCHGKNSYYLARVLVMSPKYEDKLDR